MMARVDREGPVQKAIVKYLRTVLHPDALVHSIPNENDGSARMGARLNDLGRMKGVADLIIVDLGMAHYVEIKAPKGKQRDSQREFEAAARRAGASYAVVDSVDNMRLWLEAWGVSTLEVAAQ